MNVLERGTFFVGAALLLVVVVVFFAVGFPFGGGGFTPDLEPLVTGRAGILECAAGYWSARLMIKLCDWIWHAGDDCSMEGVTHQACVPDGLILSCSCVT